MSKTSSKSLDLTLAGGLSLIALAIRLFRLEDRAIWWDEGWSVWLARHDIASIAARTASDEHPPLHYWFLSLWDGLAGESEFAVRFSSVFFAVLTVALVYRLGLSLSGRRLAVLGATFLVISRFHVWWSQDIKMYTPTVFFVLLSLYLFIRLLRGGGWLTWLGFGLITVAALYTLYLAAFVIIVENLTLAIILLWRSEWRRRSFLLKWMASQVAIGLIYLPWLGYYYVNSQTWQRLDPFDAPLFFRLYLTTMPLGLTTQVEENTLFALPFALLAGIGLLALILMPKLVSASGSWMDWRRAGGLLMAGCVLVLPLGVYLLTLPENMPYHPKVSARYLILFLPAYGLVLAAGVDYLWRRTWIAGVIVALFVFVSAGYTLRGYMDERFPNYDMRTLVSFIGDYRQDGDAVVLNSDKEWTQFVYYMGGKGGFHGVPFGARLTAEETAEWLEEQTGDAPRVWLATTPAAAVSDPYGQVEGWFEQNWHLTGSYRYGAFGLSLYARSEKGQLKTNPDKLNIEISFERGLDTVSLLGFDRWQGRLRGGDTLYLASYWRADEELNDDLFARLLLSDTEGRTVLARPSNPLLPKGVGEPIAQGTVFRTDLRLSVAASVPNGRYVLQMEVSDASSVEVHTLRVGEVEVVNVSPEAEQSGPAKELGVDFGQLIYLDGYSLMPDPVKIGERLTLTLHWRALAETEISYKVFIHLLDADGRGWGEADSLPQAGRYPTNAWITGEEVLDVHDLDVGEDVPPGEYTIAVGLYDATTGERLVVSGDYPMLTSDNRVLIPGIMIGD